MLLKSLKEKTPAIEDFTIDYQINGKISFLPVTPENTGIISVTKNFKDFTYFMGQYTNYFLQKDKIKKYEQSDELFDYNFKNNSSLERYFVKFIYDENFEDEKKEEKSKGKKEKSEKENKIQTEYYANELKFLLNKRKYNNNWKNNLTTHGK